MRNSLDEYCLYYLLLQCLAAASDSVRKEILMSASTGTDLLRQRLHNPAFWERLVADSRHPVRPLLPRRVHRLRPSAAGRRIGRRTGSLLRRRSHADSESRPCFYGLAVLNLMWFAGGAQDHPGGCGQDGWGAAANRLQCRPRSAFPLAHRGGRSPRVLDRQLGKSHAQNPAAQPVVAA